MDANDLARWTRFAAKGGIGKCTALQDCVAQGVDDLMFLKNDEVVVLLQLPQEDQYLGYCEGVVGRFHGSAVRFHSKLKKPVLAKRQSAVGQSSSRPVSVSPRSPPASSPGPANASNSKGVSSPVSSPPVRVPSLSSTPTSDVKFAQPTRISISSISPPVRHRGPSHSRTASTASSSSHYSTHSGPPSRVPDPVPVNTHARTASIASSRSVILPAHPSSDSGSEDTQLVSLPPKLPPSGTTTTPALTDGSSAHSSFLLIPTPASSTISPAAGTVITSLSQSRARSGSEKVSRVSPRNEVRRRSGTDENYMMHGRPMGEDRWSAAELDAAQEVAVQKKQQVQQDDIPAGASETSFKSLSMYSAASVIDIDDQVAATIGSPTHSLRNEDRGILQEDESDEDEVFSHDGDRAPSVSALSALSDGGFGIGMSLLRENDEDSEYEEDYDREDEETAIGHGTSAKDKEDDNQLPRTPRTVGMRVMNPDDDSLSESEGENPSEVEDDTVMPKSQSQSMSMSASASTSTVSYLPASSSSETAVSIPPPGPRPLLPTQTSSLRPTSRSVSSIAPTEDEDWESDADIYDDYRYSRHSSHSPAQRNSRRASRSSTKSARSRASERPPLPDEDGWRRGRENGTPSHKSMASERSWSSASIEPGPGGAPVTPLNNPVPVTRGADASTDEPVSRNTPSPRSSIQRSVEVTAPVTPGGASIATIGLTSPLTRAFRQSDMSVYSRQSQELYDERSQETDALKNEEASRFSTLRHPSPGLERRKIEEEQGVKSRSPALVSSLHEKVQNEFRSENSSLSTAVQQHLSVLTTRPESEPNVVVLNESPVSSEPPSSPDAKHLRIASPQSHNGSAPPSPLNPGYPPSPSTTVSFTPTAPLTINKSPAASPITPRYPVSLPAIPFTGVPPPGRPPPHMQYAQQQPYQSQPSQHYPEQGSLPPSESLHSALRMAGQQRATTIHGHIQTDLLTATGPVPISFLLPGMLPSQPLPGTQARLQPAAPQPPYGKLPPQIQNRTQSPILELESQSTPFPHPQAPPFRPSHSQDSQTQSTMTQPLGQRPMPVLEPAPGAKGLRSVDTPFPSSSPSPDAYRSNHPASAQPDRRPTGTPPPQSSPAIAPLPRANFFPKVGQVRPRSRSFSGFNSEITEKISQSLGRRSQEEGSQPFQSSTTVSRPSSLSSKTPTQVLAPSPVMSSTRGKPAQVSRPAHGPSPLSLPPTTNNRSSSPSGAHNIMPHNPVTAGAPSSVRSVDIQDSHAKRITARRTPSYSSLRQAQPTISAPSSVIFPQRHDSVPSGTYATYGDDSSLRPPSPLKSPTARQSHESDRTHNSFTRSDVSTPPPITNGSPSSSPLVRGGSLRSKISISALRGKGVPRTVREGASETPASTNGPVTPTDEDTVQIKDMEFELIRPVVMRPSSDLYRNEETVDSRDEMSVRAVDFRQNPSSVRSETLSPEAMSSLSDVRVGLTNTSPEGLPNSRKGKAVEANNSVQAHRDRELKWMSTINSGDAAQARKSKKIKKLLIEGVPSSVRYLVWAHLSNSGSKKMSNVYAQLSKRRPALARDIERDVEQSFPDHQHLRDPNGPLVSVLFAYIAMVPDLRYHRGLAIIAGNLLLQSPEEDAFWTFLAMMDSHLRPYFMPTSPQMGVDVTLFVKSVEAVDPQLAKRVFTELNVRPQDLCGVWFSSVFAGTLPLRHLHRVWDLFLYEGVTFLFRVGLAILSFSRRHLLESSKASPTSYTAYLLRLPPEALPADPEQFICQALSIKIKDDDIRKMRLKMTDTAIKQQRAPRMSNSQSSHPHLNSIGERV